MWFTEWFQNREKKMRVKGGKPLRGINSLGGESDMVKLVLKAFNSVYSSSVEVFRLDSLTVQSV